MKAWLIETERSVSNTNNQDEAFKQSALINSLMHSLMLTRRQSPFELFDRLEQQLATAERVPHAEIVETESSYTVRLELPGVTHDSIDIKATDRNLIVTAERPASTTDDNNTPLLSEFRSGTWSRSFRFPHGLDREQLNASYRDGILQINAGKAVEHTSVKVSVDS